MIKGKSLLRLSVAAAIASLMTANVAKAQQQPGAPDGAGQQVLDEVTVTGTRIRRSGMETPTPVTALDVEELGDFAPGNLVDAISWMPQFLNNSAPGNVFTFAGAAGASFLNLRGVGNNRTLVLLDGRRVTASNRLGVPDISTFPEAMIRGMEVVTGGASAAYGSDAVSGVVNFQLDTEFTGIEGHVQGGITDRSDNENWEASLAAGAPLGERAHLIASIDWFEANAVESVANRSWYQGWGTVDVNGPGQPTEIHPDVRSRNYTAGGLIRQPGSALDMLHFVEGGVAVPFVDGDVVGASRQSGGTGYLPQYGNKYEDGTGQGSLYPDTSRGSFFTHLSYDFSDFWSGYVQYIYGRNRVNFNAMGAHQEGNAWQATIFRENPFIPDSIAATMDAEGLDSFNLSRFAPRSENDLSQARAVQENELNSYTVGLDGDIGEWRVSAYYQYGRTRSNFEARRFPRNDRLFRATDVVEHPETGQPVCRSTLSFPNDGCVPMNIFGPYAPSGEAIEYALDTGQQYSVVQQHFSEVVADGVIHDGWGAGAVSLAAGLSYRQDNFSQVTRPDSLAENVPTDESQGYQGLPASLVDGPLLQFAGVGGDPIGGHFDVWEVFSEALVPLFSGGPGAEQVDLSLAVRYADYSGSGGVTAWKTGLDWRLTDEFRLRATRSRDTRAGTLAERFDTAPGGATVNDPVTGMDGHSVSISTGGNPEIEPELSDTWTVGFVYQPQWLDGLGLSVDWFDVQIKDYITQLGTQGVIDECFLGAEEVCQRITRDPGTNEITFVEDVYINAAEARVTGVDLEAVYNTDINLFGGGNEDLGVRLFASYLAENSITNVGAPTDDSAGTTNLPEYTATGSLIYRNGPLRSSITGRYIHNRTLYNEPVAPAQQVDDPRVASVFYTNLSLSYTFDRGARSAYDMYFTVENLFDRDPPRVANFNDFFGASSFPPGIHDTLGRRYTAGVRFHFD